MIKPESSTYSSNYKSEANFRFSFPTPDVIEEGLKSEKALDLLQLVGITRCWVRSY